MGDSLNNPLWDYENLIHNGGIDKCYDSFLLDKEMLNGSFTTEKNDAFTFFELDEYGESYFVTETFENRLNKSFRNAYRYSSQALNDQLNAIISSADLKTRIIAHLDTLNYLYNVPSHSSIPDTKETITKWVLLLARFLKNKSISLAISHPLFEQLNDLAVQDFETHPFKMRERHQEKIDELYKELIDKRFIDSTTKIDGFKRIFKGLPIDDSERILWIKTAQKNKIVSKTSLIHLFKNLINYDVFYTSIDDKLLKASIPLIAAIKSNNEIKEIKNLHQSLGNYERAIKSNEDYIQLDLIVSNLSG